MQNKSFAVEIYGKTTGRAGQENKYDFPPPIDSTLMFGSVVIVNKDKNDKPASLRNSEWENIYEHLFGGFEDLGEKDGDEDDEDEDEDEDDDDDEGLRTKDGYLKDGFIVDDEDESYEEDEEEEEEDDDDDDEEIKPKIKKPAPKPVKTTTKSSKKKKSEEELFTKVNQEENYLDCTSELSEEEYI